MKEDEQKLRTVFAFWTEMTLTAKAKSLTRFAGDVAIYAHTVSTVGVSDTFL